MCGFEWQDQRGPEGTGFVRALRSLLTANLPLLLPALANIVEIGLLSEFETHERIDSLRPLESTAIQPCPSG